MCDLLLDGKNIDQFAIELLRPHLIPVLYTRYLSINPNSFSLFSHTTLEYCAYLQLLRNFLQIQILALKPKRRRATGHLEVLDLGDGVDNLVSNPITEIFLSRISTQIFER